MNRSTALAVLTGLLVWASAGQAQEALIIKLKTSGEGDTVLITESEIESFNLKAEDGKGNVLLNQNKKEGKITAYQETIYLRDGTKPPTKFERSYTKCQLKTGDVAEDLELQGKTVVIEKKGEKYSYTYKDGSKVTGKSAQMLSKELDVEGPSKAERDRFLLPKGAVKVGESWKLDMGPFVKDISKNGEMEFDLPKATGTGKLLRAYKKDGRLFGDMTYQISLPLKSIGKGQEQIKFADGAKLTLDVSLDACIDGTSESATFTKKMFMSGTGQVAAEPGTILTFEIHNTGQGTKAAPAKKQ